MSVDEQQRAWLARVQEHKALARQLREGRLLGEARVRYDALTTTLLRDTRRMASALGALGATAEARYYPGGIHAFHAFVWRAEAQRCWRDTYDFLDRHG